MSIIPASIIAVLCIFCMLVHASRTENTLRIVHVVFRHGDRNPTESYPTDPYQNYSWPDGLGALTKRGKSQCYELGRTFRERYNIFFNDDSHTGLVYAKSSDADRCHMSGATFLAGLYPPTAQQIWNPLLNWQPIPLHSLPRSLDNIIAMKKKCPTYDKALEYAYNSQTIQNINNENKDLYKFLSEATGQTVNNITAVEFLYNILQIQEDNRLKLPEWTRDVYPNKMLPLAIRSLEIFTETTFMKRMKGGVLLKEIIQNTQAKQADPLASDRKMFIYSGHDITLINVLNTLNLSHSLKPEYGAAFVVEGHVTDTEKMEIKLFYFENYASKEPTELKVARCGNPCYVDDFASALDDLIPKDWERECNNNI